jgi:hypothetical protein
MTTTSSVALLATSRKPNCCCTAASRSAPVRFRYRLAGRSIRIAPSRPVNGAEANGGTMDVQGVVVSGGMLYVNSGYGGIVGRAGNVLVAFRADSVNR